MRQRPAGILSVGSYLPTETRSPDYLFAKHLAKKYNKPANYISRYTGIDSKHVAAPHSKPGDLARIAAERALVGVKVPVDAIIYAGMEQDYIEPGTAHSIAAALGISPKICKNTPDACHGFAHALHDAQLMIGSGQYHTVLICTGEIGTKYEQNAVDALIAETSPVGNNLRKMLASFTLGCAGGACVVSSSPHCKLSIDHIYPMALSRASDICRISTHTSPLEVDQSRLKSEVIDLLVPHYEKFKAEYTAFPDKILYYIVHQTSRRVLGDYRMLLNDPAARFVDTVHSCGNVISASFPLQLDRIFEQIDHGDHIVAMLQGSGISASYIGLTGRKTTYGNNYSGNSRDRHEPVRTSD